jgi:hypothetical protein
MVLEFSDHEVLRGLRNKFFKVNRHLKSLPILSNFFEFEKAKSQTNARLKY